MPYEKEKKFPEKYGNTSGYDKPRKTYIDEDESIAKRGKEREIDYLPKRVIEETVISSRLVQRMDEDKIKPLKLMSSEIIGGIFDRVDFLKRRINDLRANMDLRKQIHEEICHEIGRDIDDRNSFLQAISDINERRNLKLDISVLRKERRHEDVQFWRDMVELMEELKTQEEAYQIETKIASIFGNVENNG